jgi:hypothetical protein
MLEDGVLPPPPPTRLTLFLKLVTLEEFFEHGFHLPYSVAWSSNPFHQKKGVLELGLYVWSQSKAWMCHDLIYLTDMLLITRLNIRMYSFTS